VGIGEGRKGDQDCVVVFVAALTPELLAKLPKDIQGVPVDLRDTGLVTAY